MSKHHFSAAFACEFVEYVINVFNFHQADDKQYGVIMPVLYS